MNKYFVLIVFLCCSIYSQEIVFPKLKPESEQKYKLEFYTNSLFENQNKIKDEYSSCFIKREKYMPTRENKSKLVNTLNQKIKEIPVNSENFYFGLFPEFYKDDTFIISYIIKDTVVLKLISEEKLINRYFDNLHLYFSAQSKQLIKITGTYHVYSFATFQNERVDNIHEADDYVLEFKNIDGIILPNRCVFSYINHNLTDKPLKRDMRTKEIIYYTY